MIINNFALSGLESKDYPLSQGDALGFIIQPFQGYSW